MKRFQHAIGMLTCLVAGIAPIKAIAQENTLFQPASHALAEAENQVQQRIYALAAQSAGNFLYQESSSGAAHSSLDEQQKAQYIYAVSLLKTGRKGCDDTAVNILQQTKNPVYRDRLSLALAQYYFLHGNLTAAIPYYEKAGIANLSNTEIADAKFELAYCYFNSRLFDKADPLFAVIREVPDGKYYSAGNYYYGLLAYNRGSYEDALKSFGRIDNEPQYKSIVPYYMAEIQYYLGNRKKALEDALRLIRRTEKLFYDNELHLLAAQCLFEEQRYGDALPYFEHYYENTDKIRKEELYEMAFCYYRVSEWKSAIDKFKPLSNAQDSLGQTSLYLLGDCYLKTNDKQSARNAFGLCANMKFNAGQREAALVLHAKLSYELGYSDDALRSINTLFADFPATKYSNDAYLLQSQVFVESSNFGQAYNTLLLVQDHGGNYGVQMQRAAYGYGLQQMQQQHLETADSLLSISLSYNHQPVLEAAANFWKGDLAYRQHRNEAAIEYSKRFLDQNTLQTAVLSPEATPAHAYLNMGYAALDADSFNKAQFYFNKAKASGGAGDISANANLREADALFMQKDFAKAAPLYAQAASGTGNDADYARFQHALVLGILGKNDEKVRILQALMNAAPASRYASDARYELGVTEMASGKYAQAVATFQPIIDSKHKLAPKALLKTGTAYQQLHQDDKAEATYRELVKTYTSSPERTDALAVLKGMYIERNQPDAYRKLLEDSNLPAATDNELDAAYYSAAEAQFAAGKWGDAQIGFSKYLQQFPSGSFANKAHFYLAESFYRQKKMKDALPEYDAVLKTNWNDFSENSARRAAEIAEANKDYAAAGQYYGALRNNAIGGNNLVLAYTGLMNSAANTNDGAAAARYADTLITLPEVPATTLEIAKLYQARQLLATSKVDDAQTIFQSLQTSKSNLVAAEARYRVAESLMLQDKLKQAEDAAGKNIKLSAGNDYWVVKSYILLGDIFTKEKDFFNAKATLQSVVQHTGIEGLKAEATQKLEALKEQDHSKLSNE